MYSFAFLTSKVSDAEPCGPDLDMAFDDGFMQFMAVVDSILPESGKSAKFFEFDRAGAQLPKKIEGMKGLLEATRDLRLLSALARMQILDRQIDNFIVTIQAMDALIAERWQDVHPQAEDGDYTLRINSLEALDDFTQIVLPVQHITLFKSKRHGPIAFRHYQLSNGTIQPREVKPEEFEPIIDKGSFDAMIEGTNEVSANDLDIREMVQSRDQFSALKVALTNIQNNSQELLDFQGSIKFERLMVLTNDIVAFLENSVIKRDPTKASEPAGTEEAEGFSGDAAQPGMVSVPMGAVGSLPEVTLALRAVGNYFARFEPSSPALLLVRQAQGLVGRGFFDALRALMPSHASEANLLMGATPGFDMSVERLAEVAGEYTEPEADVSADCESENTHEESHYDSAASQDNAGETEHLNGDDAISDEGEGPDGHAEVVAPAASAGINNADRGAKVFRAKSRQEAIGLLNAVQKYYVQVEPSSPIPLLIDRARAIGSLEFSALLKLVMPKQAFKRDDEY